MITAYARGWKIVFINNQWVYADNNTPIDDMRPCAKCGCKPLPTGEDACIGHISGLRSACCGHGVESPYFIRG